MRKKHIATREEAIKAMGGVPLASQSEEENIKLLQNSF
jgi:hypothetical protein